MGVYLDRLDNLTANTPELNLSFQTKDNYIDDIIASSDSSSEGYLGLGVLVAFWFWIYGTIANPQNNFQITKTQALISTSTLIFSISIYFFWFEILSSTQHFIWFALLNFAVFTLGIFRFD